MTLMDLIMTNMIKTDSICLFDELLYLSLVTQFNHSTELEERLCSRLHKELSSNRSRSLSFFNGELGVMWLLDLWIKNGFIDKADNVINVLQSIDMDIHTKIFTMPYVPNLDTDFFALPHLLTTRWNNTIGIQRLCTEELIIALVDDCWHKINNTYPVPHNTSTPDWLSYLYLVDFCVAHRIHTVKASTLKEILINKDIHSSDEYSLLSLAILSNIDSSDHTSILTDPIMWGELAYWQLLCGLSKPGRDKQAAVDLDEVLNPNNISDKNVKSAIGILNSFLHLSIHEA